MQTRTLAVFCFFLLTVYGFSQSPTLVQDFNAGENDSYNFFNYRGVTYQDDIIFPIVGDDIGEELAILKNGELSILKDLNPGSESSAPKFFTEFKGKIFFSAFDATNGGALWVTDGTTEGTSIFFDPGDHASNAPRGLIVSRSGYLYYTYGAELFRTDGEQNESIFTGAAFRTAFEQQSDNYCQYQEEIAFLTQENDDTVRLYTIDNNEAVLLGQTPRTSSFADVFGLCQVTRGLIFGVDDAFNSETNGTFLYDKSAETVSKFGLTGGRLHPFSSDLALALVFGQGYYGLNGLAGEEELLFNASSASVTQGQGIEHAIYQDKVVFAVSEGFFGDDFLVISDGTSDGSQTLFETSAYISNILVADKYAFIASGTSNGFEPEMYYIDMEDGSFENFYNFTESSVRTDAILFLGVQNNRLYFLSNLDTSVGRELYYIDLNIPVTTNTEDQQKEATFQVRFTPSTFEVLADSFSPVLVNVFSLDGRLVETIQTSTHHTYDISHLNGFLLLQFEWKGQVITHKFFRP